jgi:regulatory protein YycH of two-component signal transduction system YycFG
MMIFKKNNIYTKATKTHLNKKEYINKSVHQMRRSLVFPSSSSFVTIFI